MAARFSADEFTLFNYRFHHRVVERRGKLLNYCWS